MQTQLKIDSSICKGCGMCAKECRVGVISLVDGKAVVVDEVKCGRCGHCAAICGSGAISIFGITPEKLPKKIETVTDAIVSRRSIRSYKDEFIPKEEIKELLNFTRFSPSAKNVRQVKWIVLNKPKMMELAPKLKEIALENNIYNESWAAMLKNGDANHFFFRNVPHIAIAYSDPLYEDYSSTDAIIMLSEFELLLTQKGYGCVWNGIVKMILENKQAKSLFGIETEVCVGCMGFGIPATRYQRTVPREDVSIQMV